MFWLCLADEHIFEPFKRRTNWCQRTWYICYRQEHDTDGVF